MKIRLNEKYDRIEVSFSGGTPDGDDNLNPVEIERKGDLGEPIGPIVLMIDAKNYIREIHIPELRGFFKEILNLELPKFPEPN